LLLILIILVNIHYENYILSARSILLRPVFAMLD
jgi:hypothetical protein